jgi:hypothetical protein
LNILLLLAVAVVHREATKQSVAAVAVPADIEQQRVLALEHHLR